MYVWGKKGIDWDTVEVCMCLEGGEMVCAYADGKTRRGERYTGGGGERERWKKARLASVVAYGKRCHIQCDVTQLLN